MLKNNYYSLVAGLPDLVFQQEKPPFSMGGWHEFLSTILEPGDLKLVELFFLPYDHKNLLNKLQGKEAEFDTRGTLAEETLDELISNKEQEPLTTPPTGPHDYMLDFVIRYKNELPAYEHFSWEDQLTYFGYNYIEEAIPNEFVKDWFRFEQNLNNILVAFNARKHNFNAEKSVIGDNEVTHALLHSKARDFGLSQDLHYLVPVLNASEHQNLLDREKLVDKTRWQKAEDLGVFSYFSVEAVLIYTIKLKVVHRWAPLQPEKGKEAFHHYIDQLQSSYEFPKDFIV